MDPPNYLFENLTTANLDALNELPVFSNRSFQTNAKLLANGRGPP
jgi:hypothetical protein